MYGRSPPPHGYAASPMASPTSQQQGYPQQGYPPQGYPNPPQGVRSPAHQHSYSYSSQTSARSGGYTPVSFDSPVGHADSFWGCLIDPTTARPTETFARLVDAMFFALDSQCDVPGLRRSGVIEPAKYGWMSMKMDGDLVEAQAVQDYIHTLYPLASIPTQYRPAPNGGTISVLDRRGWLHNCVFDAKADADDAWTWWNKAISVFNLIDPATSHPFPTPIPRSALPLLSDAHLSRVYHDWQAAVGQDMKRKRDEAVINQALGRGVASPTTSYANYFSTVGAGAPGVGTVPSAPAASSGGSSHATTTDAVTAVASLANTTLGFITGGGFSGF